MIEVTKLKDVIEEKEHGILYPSRIKAAMNKITIDVTYNCNFTCPNCNRLCGIFPRKKDIPVEMIRQLIDDSLEIRKKWTYIYISGGEPSLHPGLQEIFAELKRYVDFSRRELQNDKLPIMFITNGYSETTKKVLEDMPNFIPYVFNSRKEPGVHPLFIPLTIAPVDFDGFFDASELRPCIESWYNGMLLNYRGYYPCAESAVIDEMFLKKDLAIRSLKDINFESIARIYQETCKYCGFYFEPYGYQLSRDLKCSRTWNAFLSMQGIIPVK